jgi:hypothetical protein
MSSSNSVNRQNTGFFGLVWGMIFGLVFLLVLAVPMENIRPVVDAEWKLSTDLFGSWAVGWTNRIYDFFGVEHLMQELVRLSGADRPKFDIEAPLADWIINRIQVLNALLVIFLLRMVTLCSWMAICLPALGIVLFCGWLKREESKNVFFFTSPYKMSRWTLGFKLCLIGLVVAMLCPTAISACSIPLILCVLVFLSGKLVSGLQKEI